MRGTTYHKYICKIPSLRTLCDYGNEHRWNVVKFSDRFQGLIGAKLLRQLNAQVQYFLTGHCHLGEHMKRGEKRKSGPPDIQLCGYCSGSHQTYW